MARIGNTEQNPQPSTGKAKRYIAAAALLTGGLTVGAFLSPVGLAGAQTDDADTDTSAEVEAESTDVETDGEDEGRKGRGNRGARSEAVADLIGVDVDTLREGREAGMTLAEIAAENGVDTDTLVAGLVDLASERMAEAVEAGRIDQADADEKLADATERITELVNAEPGERGEGRGHHGPRGHKGGFGGLGDVADSLGLDADTVREGLSNGDTLAEIAEANGSSEAELVDALVAAGQERIDAAVEAGRIDADRAAELTDGLEERVTEMVNAEPGERGDGDGRRGRGPGRGKGLRDGGPGADAEAGDVEETSFSA
ncbi:MAG: hypothetical protein AAF467_04835 [Actinomycetota bacterium]